MEKIKIVIGKGYPENGKIFIGDKQISNNVEGFEVKADVENFPMVTVKMGSSDIDFEFKNAHVIIKSEG